MADISMCNSTKCPVRTTCKRNAESGTQKSSMWQSYCDFGDEKCDDYLEIKEQKS